MKTCCEHSSNSLCPNCDWLETLERKMIIKTEDRKYETFKEFGEKAHSMAFYDAKEIQPLAYAMLGLAGETGEVSEKIKKFYRDNKGKMTPEIKNSILLELSDCLWYINEMAIVLDSNLEEVANKNIEKLESRMQRGKLAGSGDNR